MTTAAHVNEHNDIMMLVAKIAQSSKVVEAAILITFDDDGCPCVGSYGLDLEDVMPTLQVVASSENQIVKAEMKPLDSSN